MHHATGPKRTRAPSHSCRFRLCIIGTVIFIVSCAHHLFCALPVAPASGGTLQMYLKCMTLHYSAHTRDTCAHVQAG